MEGIWKVKWRYNVELASLNVKINPKELKYIMLEFSQYPKNSGSD